MATRASGASPRSSTATPPPGSRDRKSTRLNSSHANISYAVFCLKKKNAHELVEIGDHFMFANGCFFTDSNHRFDDPDQPMTWQVFTTNGPTLVDDNLCGVSNVFV